MEPEYDTIIAGGSLAGLLAAREIASQGLRVLVLEDDQEIGVPEKCDGLVSRAGLTTLGVIPTRKIVLNEIKRAVLHSPSGSKVEVDAVKQGVVVISRKNFDQTLASQAVEKGAEIQLPLRVEEIEQVDEHVRVRGRDKSFFGKIAIDARGFQSLDSVKRKGILQAAKFEVEGNWIERDVVELFFDQKHSSGFFTWIIPLREGLARVGVAGIGINTYRVLEKFLASRGGVVLKRIAAPIVVAGPRSRFLDGRIMYAGDAAGQTKPTTGGGIYSCGIGGILAGAAAAECLKNGNLSELAKYEKTWRKMFGDEFKKMLLARGVFERLNNEQLDRLVQILAGSNILSEISERGDFDRHSFSILKMLGVRGVLDIAFGELKALVSSLKP